VQVLRGEVDARELYEEEEDDEDFVLDWDQVMGTNPDAPAEGAQLHGRDCPI
jgi:hypothetical protein